MYKHFFRYNVKCAIRNRKNLVLTLIFPLLLGVLFYFGLNNKENTLHYSLVDIGAVVIDDSDSAELLKELLLNVSNIVEDEFSTLSDLYARNNADDVNEDITYFNIAFMDMEMAERKLSLNEIDGIVLVKQDPGIIINQSGEKQIFLEEYMNLCVQKLELLNITDNTFVYQELEQAAKLSGSGKLDNSMVNDMDENSYMLIYYFSLLAFSCLCGYVSGIDSVKSLKPDCSAVGIRSVISGYSLIKQWLYTVAASTIVHICKILIIVNFYMILLKVDLARPFGMVFVIGVAGSLAGIMLGSAAGCLFSDKGYLKYGVGMIVMLLCGLSAGMMNLQFKYTIQEKIPLITKLNPASLLADAFYYVYYGETYQQLWVNLAILGIFSLVFMLIVIAKLRRRTYDRI